MWVKFLQPYQIFAAGDVADMLRSKAATLKSEGIITDDQREVRRKTPADKPVPADTEKTVVPSQPIQPPAAAPKKQYKPRKTKVK